MAFEWLLDRIIDHIMNFSFSVRDELLQYTSVLFSETISVV